jgi:hypothetical protein
MTREWCCRAAQDGDGWVLEVWESLILAMCCGVLARRSRRRANSNSELTRLQTRAKTASNECESEERSCAAQREAKKQRGRGLHQAARAGDNRSGQ